MFGLCWQPDLLTEAKWSCSSLACISTSRGNTTGGKSRKKSCVLEILVGRTGNEKTAKDASKDWGANGLGMGRTFLRPPTAGVKYYRTRGHHVAKHEEGQRVCTGMELGALKSSCRYNMTTLTLPCNLGGPSYQLGGGGTVSVVNKY